MNVPGAISAIAWQSLLADAIPEERRADALAVRSRVVTAVAFLPTLLGGYVLDALEFPIGYQLVLGVAFASSVAEVRVLMKMREPAAAGQSPSRPMQGETSRARLPRSFMVFCLCTALFYVGWIMGAPLFTLYYVTVLEVGNLWVGAFNVISMVVQYLVFPWWSRLARSRGSVLGLGLATAGMALTPVMIAVSPSPWLVAVFCVSMGVFTSGTTLLLLDSLLDSVPEEGRTSAIAVYNVCVNLASFVGPLVGNAVVDGAGIYWAMAACALLRGIGAASIVGFARSVAQPASGCAQPRSARMASL
ncbi:MAG: Major Facilitator Superfamily protein [Firmicutes bacterium ADurb.Bin506]|nr:MAG: Major Facilitator Superfamily protein [Firmicutes bacterium ADurb.Bin506]